jgi:hypothetical protein
MDHEREPRFASDEARELVQGLASVSKDLASLATFIRAAEVMRTHRPDAATERRHLAAIAAETARLRAQPVATPSERGPAEQGPTVLGVLRSRWFKGTAIGIAAVLATGGLAAAQVLPAPAQDAVARVAHAIGIDLPMSDLDGDGIPSGEDPDPERPAQDANGDGVPDDGSEGGAPLKDGLDHDGDGIPDDSGEHTGQTTPKDGLDHDGDGIPDDSGERAKPDAPARDAPKSPRPEKTAKPDAPATPKGGPADDAGPPDDKGKPAPTG